MLNIEQVAEAAAEQIKAIPWSYQISPAEVNALVKLREQITYYLNYLKKP